LKKIIVSFKNYLPPFFMSIKKCHSSDYGYNYKMKFLKKTNNLILIPELSAKPFNELKNNGT